MATSTVPAASAPPRRTRPQESTESWPLIDRLGLAACWAAGITLTLVTAGIVLFMFIKGLQYLQPELLWTRPSLDVDQSKSGGFLDPIVGTVTITAIGTAIAAPIGVGIAVWLAEYGRPVALARVVESGVDIVAGVPSIVLAIFGLIVFSNDIFAALSFTPESATSPLGRSFLIAGLVMSFIALPLIVGATREALNSIPNHAREASYALGKNKWTTIRSVLLPSIRPGIATGTALGMGRIIGDTAIVIVLLGATLNTQPSEGGVWPLNFFQGQGSTLTSYVYANSPVGEGNAAGKAYAAAFVLLLVILLLNYAVDRLTRGGKETTAWTR